jgi:solute carrier family 50 protein (sugar transporter)
LNLEKLSVDVRFHPFIFRQIILHFRSLQSAIDSFLAQPHVASVNHLKYRYNNAFSYRTTRTCSRMGCFLREHGSNGFNDRFFRCKFVRTLGDTSFLNSDKDSPNLTSSQPFPTIKKVGEQKSVGSLPLLPYSSMVANCFLWVIYGLLKREAKVWGTNVIGLGFGLFYFFKFSKFAPKRSPTLPGSIRQHRNAILAVIATTISLVFLPAIKDPAKIVGLMGVVFCIALFGSPLASLKTVLETKSAASIPLPFTLATVANCFFWSVTGLFDMNDINVYLPNLLGLSFGIAQMALKCMYGDGKQLQADLLL